MTPPDGYRRVYLPSLVDQLDELERRGGRYDDRRGIEDLEAISDKQPKRPKAKPQPGEMAKGRLRLVQENRGWL